MENDKGETIGVMQLINAKNDKGKVVPFVRECEIILLALASQAAISLTNMNYTKKMEDLMESIVETFSTAIYHRTPYNVHHTRNMVHYATRFIDYLDESDQGWQFSERQKRQFLMSIWLHDVGKLVIPLEVMNKGTRLDSRLEEIMLRFDMISLLGRVEALEKGEDGSEFQTQLQEARELIVRTNSQGFVAESLLEEVRRLGERYYVDQHGESQPWLNEDEVESLCIRFGTLTEREREIMQSHVTVTKDILSKIKFDGDYANVPKWAAAHHEFLDGTGYPEKREGESLDMESRLLTMLDIFEGLTAMDRPYKSGISPDRALVILGEMVEEGKLDAYIYGLFAESRVWELDD